MRVTLNRKIWLAGILGALTLAAAAACGGATEPDAQGDRAEMAAPAGAASGAPVVHTSDGTAERVQRRSAAVGAPSEYAEDEASAMVVAAASGDLAGAAVAALEEVLSGIYERTLPGVVHVRASQTVGGSGSAPGLGQPFPLTPLLEGEGSGFVWSADGHVLTNQHVIAGADLVTVTFADGLELEAEVLGSDADSDLAVLMVEAPEGGLHPVDLGDSDDVKVGHFVATIGNPFGQRFTLTSGIISALGRTIQGNSRFSIPDVLQTDAAINPGNSGGPLLDRLGRVIGINSQILSRSGSSSGVGFAVPVNLAKRVVPELIEHGRYHHPFLGLTGAALRPSLAEAIGLPDGTRGVLVVGVIAGGPVDEAGLMPVTKTRQVDGVEVPADGDVIVSVDSVAVRGMDELITYLMRNTRPGDKVSLELVRVDGESGRIEVVLRARPSEE